MQEKVRELETAKNEIVKLKEVADRASKISQSNSDLVVRKCALEVQNNQKDKIISEQVDKIANYEAILNKNQP